MHHGLEQHRGQLRGRDSRHGGGGTDNNDRCTREGGSISKVIPTTGYYGISVSYDLRAPSLGTVRTGWGDGGCAVRNDDIQEQLNIYYSTDGGTNWIQCATVWRADLDAYIGYGTRTVSLAAFSDCDNNANFALMLDWQFNQAAITLTWTISWSPAVQPRRPGLR